MSDGILVAREGSLGRIVLDRPAALNALTPEMIAAMRETLAAWQRDPDVAVVIVRGNGRAFCAGGDIRAAVAATEAGDEDRNDRFYADEYALDGTIARYEKPYVAAMHGACMGGGLALAVHGAFRVARADALVAMPETAIGFFPDVGCSYVLPRLPGAVGTYLALTATRLSAVDALASGIVTHLVDDDTFASLDARLLERGVRTHGDVGALLDGLAQPAAAAHTSMLARERPAIDRCFGESSVPRIVAALENEGTEWSKHALGALRRVSPAAVYVTFELLRRGATRDLDACLALEFALSRPMRRRRDFSEGVRAAVIEKTGNPQWNPARLEDVDEDFVDAIFAGIP